MHALKVLRRLHILDTFDGIIYLDHGKELVGKPDTAAYKRAMELLDISNPRRIYFVDDNEKYCQAALDLGWNVSHRASGPNQRKRQTSLTTWRALDDLHSIFPEIFQQSTL